MPRYYLYEKESAHGSLYIKGYDGKDFVKDDPNFYEVSAFWYYAYKVSGLTKRAVDGLIVRAKSWWLAQFARH